MAKRFYFCSLLGAGTDQDPYRCWFQANNVPMKILDMRAYPQIEDGFMVAWGEISDADHALAIADPSVTYLPFENASGVTQPLTATLNNVSSANRTAVQNIFTAHGIPTAGITLTWTIAQVMQLARRRMALGLLLSNLDFDEPTELLSAMPRHHLKALKRALENYGFDTSGLTLTMTQGQAIAALAAQAKADELVNSIPGLTL